MLLQSALKGMETYREALRSGSASNPSLISENTHKLASYIACAEDNLAELEYELEVKESESFNNHISNGKSVNAAKESVRREFTKERAMIVKVTRLVSSGWRLVSESQSRVKHLIAEANNQIYKHRKWCFLNFYGGSRKIRTFNRSVKSRELYR